MTKVKPPTTTTHEAIKLLQHYAQKYPNAWNALDDLRNPNLRRQQRIPDEVYTPIGAGIAVVTHGSPNGQRMLLNNPELLRDAAVLACLHSWRQTKGIYKFDPSLLQTIASSDLSKGIPAELLTRLPEWCIYVETPGFDMLGPIAGYFAWFDVDKLRPTPQGVPYALELRILTIAEDGELGLYPLPLRATIAEGIAAMNTAGKELQARIGINQADAESVREEITSSLEPLIALLLYLCSERPDISQAQGKQPHKPQPIRVKGGLKHFAPNLETVYNVASSLGRELGQALASEDQPCAPNAVRPHVRRAHFHVYRTGKGRTERVLRWVAPTLVGVRSGEQVNATTVRNVKP